MSPLLPKRSVIVAGHRTSVSLENEFWDRFTAIAASKSTSINALVTEIDDTRGERNLSSAIRLYVLAEVEQGAIAKAAA